jgi:hypothetical protein
LKTVQAVEGDCYLSDMLHRLFRALRRGNSSFRPESLLSLEPGQTAHLLVQSEGLPHVDWAMASRWIEHQEPALRRTSEAIQRAVAAAWLDALGDAVETDSRRWRSAAVEGLAPAAGNVGPRVAGCADRSIAIIGKALARLRGDPREHPISPVAVVALGTDEEYYSFISHFYSEEGAYATSGGIYIRDDGAFPLLALNTQSRYNLEATVAHELTHHALKPDPRRGQFGAGLPLWAEEGLTQMMEEHVTRVTNFNFGREMLDRHRVLWDTIGLDGFVEGETFHSPEDERQELSYNLAEALVRSLLATRPQEFWAFARACYEEGDSPDHAARTHFDSSEAQLAADLIGLSTDED